MTILAANDIYQDDATFSIVFHSSDSTVSSMEQQDEDWDESLSSASSVSLESYTFYDDEEIIAIQSFEKFLICDDDDDDDESAIQTSNNDIENKKKTASISEKTTDLHVNASVTSSLLSSIQRSIGFISTNNKNTKGNFYSSSKRDRVMMARLVSQDLCRSTPPSSTKKSSSPLLLTTIEKKHLSICPDSPGALTAVSDASSNSSATSSVSYSGNNNFAAAVTTTQDALLTRHTLQLLMNQSTPINK